LAYTQAQLTTLKESLSRGVKRLKMDGEEIEFASLSEMRRLVSDIEAELAGKRTNAMTVITPLVNRGL
jgi:hypothetical protein